MQKECEKHTDCRLASQKCHEYQCKAACRVENPCGENALCVSEDHAAKCRCREGYSGDAYRKCLPVDYCKSKPCGPGAACENDGRGSYVCKCPPGTVGDAYSDGCAQPVECRLDDDCPMTARCTTIRSEPKCTDVCQSTSCGPNAVCKAVNHLGVCECIEGYAGNPSDALRGCIPQEVPCRLNNDCPFGTICDGGYCRGKYLIYPKNLDSSWLNGLKI